MIKLYETEKGKQLIQQFKDRMEALKNGERQAYQPVTRPLTYKDKVIREIRKRYSADDEIALLNNYNLYLQDNSLSNYKTEYDAYQAYRLQCKQNTKETE